MAKPGRPKKTDEQRWLDEFADSDLQTQARLLDLAAVLHRQARRGRLASIPAPQELLVPDVETMETGAKQ